MRLCICWQQCTELYTHSSSSHLCPKLPRKERHCYRFVERFDRSQRSDNHTACIGLLWRSIRKAYPSFNWVVPSCNGIGILLHNQASGVSKAAQWALSLFPYILCVIVSCSVSHDCNTVWKILHLPKNRLCQKRRCNFVSVGSASLDCHPRREVYLEPQATAW